MKLPKRWKSVSLYKKINVTNVKERGHLSAQAFLKAPWKIGNCPKHAPGTFGRSKEPLCTLLCIHLEKRAARKPNFVNQQETNLYVLWNDQVLAHYLEQGTGLSPLGWASDTCPRHYWKKQRTFLDTIVHTFTQKSG